MRIVNLVGDLHQPLARRSLAERLALEELLDHEIGAVGLLINIEELDDIGVIDRRERLGLPEETVARLSSSRCLRSAFPRAINELLLPLTIAP